MWSLSVHYLPCGRMRWCSVGFLSLLGRVYVRMFLLEVPHNFLLWSPGGTSIVVCHAGNGQIYIPSPVHRCKCHSGNPGISTVHHISFEWPPPKYLFIKPGNCSKEKRGDADYTVLDMFDSWAGRSLCLYWAGMLPIYIISSESNITDSLSHMKTVINQSFPLLMLLLTGLLLSWVNGEPYVLSKFLCLVGILCSCCQW